MSTRSLSSRSRALRGLPWRLLSLRPGTRTYASKVGGVDGFGDLAPGDIVMKKLGMKNLSAEISTMN